MTLKEYLEKQMRYYAEAKNEFPVGHHLHHLYMGYYQAYADVILQCPDSVLSKKILDEVW